MVSHRIHLLTLTWFSPRSSTHAWYGWLINQSHRVFLHTKNSTSRTTTWTRRVSGPVSGGWRWCSRARFWLSWRLTGSGRRCRCQSGSWRPPSLGFSRWILIFFHVFVVDYFVLRISYEVLLKGFLYYFGIFFKLYCFLCPFFFNTSYQGIIFYLF